MRIVSLAPSNTEILFALGVGEQVVGVTAFCDYPQEVKTLPKVGGWTTANSHKILALKPDLVITSTFLQQEAPQRFRNYPFKLLHVDPKDLNSVFESFLTIGKAVKRQHQARTLVKKMHQELKKPTRTTPSPTSHNLNREPRIYIEEWHQPPMVSGNWVPELVVLASADYFPIKPSQPSRAVTDEEINAFNPEIILLSLCGFGKRPTADIVTKRKAWKSIYAVKNNRVYVVDDSYFNRPGPRLIKGLEQLGDIIHLYHTRQ